MPNILTPIRARPAVSRLRVLAILLCTAAAAWLSQATIAPAGAGDARFALLPVSGSALAICAAAAVCVLAAWRAGASLAPVWLLVLLALPWLPKSSPAAFLMWSGPLALSVWVAMVLGLWSSTPVWQRLGAGPWYAWLTARPRLTAAALACGLYGLAAWQVAPSVPGGDEPHYLIITQSILQDRDLKIENNHRQRDYEAYFGRSIKPDFLKRSKDGQIYSIHAPGLPAIIAPAFALLGYRGVLIELVLLSTAASALVWFVAWRVTSEAAAAWFAWAAVT
jgi:hypothetical protein